MHKNLFTLLVTGQYLWPSYISMVAETHRSLEKFYKLLEWKSCKSPFMDNQIEAFAVQLPKHTPNVRKPKRTIQANAGLLEQIQKFVLPEKVFEVLGEDMNFVPKYIVSPMDD